MADRQDRTVSGTESPNAAYSHHVVQFSTGLGSAEVLRRVVGEQGPRNVVALSADTTLCGHDATGDDWWWRT